MHNVYSGRTISRLKGDLVGSEGNGPVGSSPHMVDINWIRENLCFSERRSYLYETLIRFIYELECCGLTIQGMLLGGSFFSEKKDPKDIDALFVYAVKDSADFESVKSVLTINRRELDVRIVPSDASLGLLIKNVCFHHTLYQAVHLKRNDASLFVDLSQRTSQAQCKSESVMTEPAYPS